MPFFMQMKSGAGPAPLFLSVVTIPGASFQAAPWGFMVPVSLKRTCQLKASSSSIG